MATFYIPMFGWQTIGGSSGDAFFEPYGIKASNDRWGKMVATYNNGASPAEIFGQFRVPENYAGSACVVSTWTSTATAGSVVYRVLYRSVAETESYDQTGQTENASLNVSAPSAVNLRQDAVIPIAGSNLVAGDEVEFEYLRDPTDGSDDMAAATTVHGLYFGYQDS